MSFFKAYRSPESTSRSAFTLTELAIVMGIIGTMISAIWVASAKISSTKHVDKAMQEVMQIVQGVRALYTNGHFDGTNDISAALIKFGVYPSDTILQSACPGTGSYSITLNPCPVDPWNGGAVQVGTSISWWGAPSGSNNFTIMFWNANMKDCELFMARLIQDAPSSGLVWAHAAGISDITSPASASVTSVLGCTGYVTLAFSL